MQHYQEVSLLELDALSQREREFSSVCAILNPTQFLLSHWRLPFMVSRVALVEASLQLLVLSAVGMATVVPG